MSTRTEISGMYQCFLSAQHTPDCQAAGTCTAGLHTRSLYRFTSLTVMRVDFKSRRLANCLWPPCVADADIIFCPVVSFFFFLLFYSARNARIASAVLATAIPSVCLSVRPSHASIVSKRRHVARCSLHRWIAKCV